MNPMKWNFLVALCIAALLVSVFNGYTVPGVVSGIALLAMTKVAGVKIVARMKKR
jgi:hypothetical protein